MKVVKRNGKRVEFDFHKISKAIRKAAQACYYEGDTTKLVNKVDQVFVEETITETENHISVDQITEWIESALEVYAPQVCDTYRAYRIQRDTLRKAWSNHDDTHTALSEYTLHSKYAKEGESWEDVCARVRAMHQDKFPDLADEIQRVFDDFVVPKKVLPSMRSLQFGGAAIKANNARMFNCSFSLADRPEFFHHLFWLLLSGCGVGYSVQKQHIEKLPEIRKPSPTNILYWVVEDTIEGWACALEGLIDSYTVDGCLWVEFEYSEIRPQGQLLKTSGGIAPGHIPLKIMLEKVRSLLDNCAGRQLTSVEVHRLCCLIAEAVLAGGIRRSSLICLFDSDDHKMMNLKTGEWWKTNPEYAMANNSAVMFPEDDIRPILDAARSFGEPGIFFTDNPNHGTNPCGEIGLNPKHNGETGFAFCNLTEISGRYYSPETVRAATFLGTLQAAYDNMPFLGETTRKIHERDRLLGVSVTGISDQEINWCPDEAIVENSRVAKLIGIQPAARVTCVKPSGTASCLLRTSSGIHPHHSKRYIRRVTANPNEPVFQEFRKVNPHACIKKPNGDWVIEFAIQAPEEAILRDDETAIEFLTRVREVYRDWVRPGSIIKPYHNVSCTVTVRETEWSEVAQYLYNWSDQFKALAFLPHTGDKVYDFAPFESVTDTAGMARWLELVEKFKPVNYSAGVTDYGAACEGIQCTI